MRPLGTVSAEFFTFASNLNDSITYNSKSLLGKLLLLCVLNYLNFKWGYCDVNKSFSLVPSVVRFVVPLAQTIIGHDVTSVMLAKVVINSLGLQMN